MLEKLDLTKKLSKDEYNKAMDVLGEKLGEVQRKAREAKRPIIIVFEGWRGARRSTIINKIMQQMDARGFNVFSSVKMSDEERTMPFFTYFWQHLPPKGHIVVYHRSWYYLKNECDIEFRKEKDKWLNTSFEHINNFEKELTDDNYILLKFFLHISEKQQAENLAKNYKTLGKAWKEISPAYDESGEYKLYLERYEKMLEATDKTNAPWHIVAADDARSAQVDVFKAVIDTIEHALKVQNQSCSSVPRIANYYNVLAQVDLNKNISKSEYKDKLDKYQEKLRLLQIEVFKAGISAVIGFEGWDAAGKGGTIRRLTAALDPLGYSVNPVAAPNIVEKQFHYLWRFWLHLPKPGSIAIFDRTWYGRVMVERLEGFAAPHEWQRAYEEIKDMEAQWSEHGIAIAKFWLQIDKDEQYRRFKEREGNPQKTWKITDEDWRNREKWDAYEEAVNEMLIRTDTSYAPWTIVEGNNKYYARLKVLQTVIDLFEKKLNDKNN